MGGLTQGQPGDRRRAVLTPPTLTSLVKSFPRVAQETLREMMVPAGGGGGGSFTAHALSRVTTAFMVIDDNPVEGSEPEDFLSRVKHALKVEDDFGKAVKEADALLTKHASVPSERPQVMVDWVTKAKQRLALDAAVSSLNKKVASR